ncbi:MAG TPA: M20 family peptidase [Burkholderiaceae bacterium]|nr:M20 family peptidase [Burkholderiaceae bacterium]
MIKRIFLAVLALVALLVLAVAINTWRQGSRQIDVPPLAKIAVDEKAAGESLAVAIRAKTVSSRDDRALNADQFQALHAHLQARYPKLHAALEREVVGGLSLLYTWKGSDPAAQPILLMAHQDVVPIAPGTEKDWQAEPFAGTLKDGYIWGRGAWDNKANLISQMEAIEMLVGSGFKPQRTVYLAFGADEEVGGLAGAKLIAELLAQRKVKLDFVIDEGLLITEGVLPGLAAPAAIVGIAEKGFMSVVLGVNATPGHSSIPPAQGTSAIAMMSHALARLDDHQLPAEMKGVAREMFETIAPEMSGMSRVAMSNLWLFGPLVKKQLEAGASTNAMLRTTTALTIFNAGNQENVLPGRAEATVNFRLLPGDTLASVQEHVKKTVANERFEYAVLPGAVDPSKVAPTDSASYKLIERSLRELFPGTVVVPGLMVGGTDSQHFGIVSDHIYKFSPVRAKPEDLPRFHGTNERISAANLAELIRFYHRLVEQGAK